jgi:hypothetical protein
MKRGNVGVINLVNSEVIATGTAKVVVVSNPYGGRAYLDITTTSEAVTASLNLAITSIVGNIGTAKTIVTALTTPITADGAYLYLLGSEATAAGDIIQVFKNPLPPNFTVTFTCSGGSSSFVVNASLTFC